MASSLLEKKPPKFDPPDRGQSARSRVERAAAFGCKVVLSYSSEAEFQALGDVIVEMGLENVGLRKVSDPVPKSQRKSPLQVQIDESRRREQLRQIGLQKKATRLAKPPAPERSVFDEVRAHRKKMAARRQDKLLKLHDPEKLVLRAVEQIATRQRASVDIYAQDDDWHFLDLVRSKMTVAPGRDDIRIHKASKKPSPVVREATVNHQWDTNHA